MQKSHMKRIFLLIAALAFCAFARGQSVYYGYPNSKELNKGDLIIVSLPEHLHMRFVEADEMGSLYEFLEKNKLNRFNILIHLFLDSPEYDLSVSEHLKKNLEGMLIQRCRDCNFSVIPKGQSSPVFLRDQESSSLYRKMNTRMEILIE